MTPEELHGALEADLQRLLATSPPIKYDNEGWKAIRNRCVRTISQRCEPGYDPYRYTGRQYDADVFVSAISKMHGALVRPMWRILSQHTAHGFDPYNNPGPCVTLVVHVPPHATRKP